MAQVTNTQWCWLVLTWKLGSQVSMGLLALWSDLTWHPSKFTFPLTQMSISYFFLSNPFLACLSLLEHGSVLSPLLSVPKLSPRLTQTMDVMTNCTVSTKIYFSSRPQIWTLNQQLPLNVQYTSQIHHSQNLSVSHTKTPLPFQLFPSHLLSCPSQKLTSHPWFFSFTHSAHPIYQQDLCTS